MALLLFFMFNLCAGIYNIYTLRIITQTADTNNKWHNACRYVARAVIHANQLIFGASVLLYALTNATLLPPNTTILTSACFIICGIINFLAVFVLTPFYISVTPQQIKIRPFIASAAVILSALYFWPHTKIINELKRVLSKHELHEFYPSFLGHIADMHLHFGVLVFITSVFSLYLLRALHHNAKGWKRIAIALLLTLAYLMSFLFFYMVLEYLFALLPNSAITSSYFHDFDQLGGLVRFAILLFILISNLCHIAVFTPLYAYNKRHQSRLIENNQPTASQE